jgi:hypothetical protein
MGLKRLFARKLLFVPIGLALISCSNEPPKPSTAGTSAPPASLATPTSEAAEVKACDFLSLADAQQIMGAPMKVSPGTRATRVCMYEEVAERPKSMGPGRVSLTVNKYGSDSEENNHWARLKEVRNIAPGEKNVSALSGLGDEAWWTGHIEKGKTDVAAVIVRHGSYDFELDNMVIGYFASPDAMKSVAKRITGQLK